MKKYRTQIIVLVLILSGALLGMTSLSRPKLVPASAPAMDFSAERAMEHVSSISQAPHPLGSEEIERVRTYILTQLEDMGLSPEIQETTIAVPDGTAVIASTIKNIIAVVPGSNSSKAILLDAHYDTRAMTPGASDCSSCVATVLETARVLLKSPQLKNDVFLLFTDNEEYGGGLGAGAFIAEHPLVSDIGLVLNFEGLGSTGPAILFETGPNSAWAVQDWGQVVSFPVGQSWFQEIYSLTPIGTDLNWFSDAGIPGMNFGHWANGPVYHASTDNPETLDTRSIQHHGSYALGLLQHYGNKDLTAAQSINGSQVYFTLLPGLLIHYPAGWALPLAILSGLLLICIAVYGHRTKQITFRGALKGLGGFFLSLVISSGLATGIWMASSQVNKEYQAMLTFRGMVYNAQFYVYAFAALAVAIAAIILIWTRRKTSVVDLHFGALSFIWLLALVTSVLFPGFSYLFTWPMFFSALSLGWVLWRNPSRNEETQLDIILTLGALPALMIIAPSIYVMYHFALAPMIGVLAFLVSLLLGTLIPQIDMLTRTHKWRLPLVSMGVYLLFLFIGSLTASFSPENPRPNAVAYLLDADSGGATWFSGGTQQDVWTQQFLSRESEHGAVGDLFPIPQRSGFPIMKTVAPKIHLEVPEVEILTDQISGNVRTLQLHLRSPRSAEVFMLDVEPYAAVRGATIAGKRIESRESQRSLWSLTYYAIPERGFDITLKLDPTQDIRLQISDQTWDLIPEVLKILENEYQSRPADMMPMPNFDYGTVVVKTFPLD
jgi:hypothetical protein